MLASTLRRVGIRGEEEGVRELSAIPPPQGKSVRALRRGKSVQGGKEKGKREAFF